MCSHLSSTPMHPPRFHFLFLVRSLACLVEVLPLVTAEPVHLPLFRQGGVSRSRSGTRHPRRRAYGPSLSPSSQLSSRQSTDFPLTDQETDNGYFINVNVGTPPQTFQLVLDTGNADIVVGGMGCIHCIPGVTALYDPTKSSTAVNKSTPITLRLGSGTIQGVVFTDTISLGSYTVLDAGFLQATQMTGGLFDAPTSGLFSLGFPGLSVIKMPTFWQSISDPVSSPGEMSFWLARVAGAANKQALEPGGVFTFGGTNASLFTGDIEFLPLAGGNSYWTLNVSALTVQGRTLSVTSATNQAAIDVAGTTFIVGPSTDIPSIWALVPGSSEISNQPGRFQYPCSTNVSVSVSFGGRSWPINPVDLNLGPVSNGSDQCVGAIVAQDGLGPSWVFGDTFLKNVYTVLRETPPAVGFAELSVLAGGSAPQSPSSASSSIPSPTHSVSPTSSPSQSKKPNVGAIAGGVVGGLVAIFLILFALWFIRTRRREGGFAVSESQPPAMTATRSTAPLSFVVDQDMPSRIQTPSLPAHSSPSPIPSPSPPLRSISTLKHEQTAAVHGSDNTRINSDQDSQRPSDARELSRLDVSVLHQLQTLREDVDRLTETQRPAAPPSYTHDDWDD
ncbi:acid protease [Favolaschia claudopus]|uniref:Acid protease n=1 Tax=Favolaschia claudopus TaxID=2862362 RepID=A0AAW0BBM0_9AGAR